MADRPPAEPPVTDALLEAALEALPEGVHVRTGSTRAATALRRRGRDATDDALAPGEAAHDAVALLDDEVSDAGEHAEGLIAELTTRLRPGGLLLATVRGRAALHEGRATAGPRRYSAAGLRHLVEHRGCLVETLVAPAVGSLLRGEPPAYDAVRDRQPGLLDAGPRLLVVTRTPRTMHERSVRFLAALPRKVASAATITRDEVGRLLVVFDSFRGHWTIPGGVVDADEDPRTAAERETWEEAGVRVHAGHVLGLFAASWPDRLMLVYGARLAEPASKPRPVHTHEVSDARFVHMREAETLLAPKPAEQVRRCLDDPGRSWVQ